MPSPLLLDSNLTVLFVVGLADPAYIGKHKRLDAFDEGDFNIVSSVISNSSGIIFTPNVLTETSNLARQINDPIKTHISHVLAHVIAQSNEMYVDSRVAVAHSDYIRLGITDAVLLTLSKSGGVLLTVDLDLYLAAQYAGLNSVNYNHLREQREDYR
jgi:hypothetical protein